MVGVPCHFHCGLGVMGPRFRVWGLGSYALPVLALKFRQISKKLEYDDDYNYYYDGDDDGDYYYDDV